MATTGAISSGVIAGDTIAATTTGAFSGKNAVVGKTVAVNVGLSGTDAGNYTVASAATTLADITPKTATVTANDSNKTFDTLPYLGGNGVTVTGLVGGEDASVLAGNVVYGGTAQGAVDIGTYTLTASGLSSSNYTLVNVAGALRIAIATLASSEQYSVARRMSTKAPSIGCRR